MSDSEMKPAGNLALDSTLLGDHIRSRFIDDVNGLSMHVLEAGFEGMASKPCLMLLHGFPELAFSWRKIMPALAGLGYYVVAPDLRGYGRTTGWKGNYEDDIAPFSLCRMSGDIVALVHALGRDHVDCLVGHDFGSPVAGTCALLRPDIFRSVVLMSAPFAGPPLHRKSLQDPKDMPHKGDLPAELARLARPRKHYQWYYSGPEANADMLNCSEGLSSFFRNYYHHKSADWPGNQIYPLPAMSATEMAVLPTYYIMDAHHTMPQAVAEAAPNTEQIRNCLWLSNEEIALYANEYQRTGFQGGLQCYRCGTSGLNASDLALYAGRTLDVPSVFLSGANDWGVYQFPGDFESMTTRSCTQMRSPVLIDNAGHWVQQEQPDAVIEQIEVFLKSLS